MIPGPILILKTPHSEPLVKIDTLLSGNTCGVRQWTDGKQEAPMLPDQPWLRRHPATGELFWTDECEERARQAPWEDGGPYRDVPFAESPTLDDYRHALSSGFASTLEKQQFVLVRYWWLTNDPFRHGKVGASLPADWRDHLSQLVALLDTTQPDQRIVAAEVTRQLGDFPKAAELLDFPFRAGYADLADLIRKLTCERNSTVQEVT
jgi:hypothetical protein